jgi:hypothetical protein
VIEPDQVEVVAGAEQLFTATVQNVATSELQWSASGGEITATGTTATWTAPASPGTYRITATSVSDPTQKATATALVIEPDEPPTVGFNAYRGTAATLPAGIFVAGEDGEGNLVGEGFDPFTGVSDLADSDASFDGFGAFTNGGGAYSFGVRERGEADLREARIFLRYPNTAGEHIVGFDIDFDLEVWLKGERANRVRLKFNTGTDGFSEIPDIVSVTNPRGRATGAAIGTTLDGTLPENRARVSTRFVLADIPDGFGGMIGSLAPGDTGFFRWQYSNADGDAGTLRSALALSNIRITPIYGDPAPPTSSAPPVFSHGAGFYTEPFKLRLSSPQPTAVSYYTVDGSVPDPDRVMDDGEWATLPVATRARTFVYTEPIDLARLAERADEISLIPTGDAVASHAWRAPLGESYKGTTLRALVVANSIPSEQVARTYFITPHGSGRYTLPVLSIATDRSNLFDHDRGIYIPGATGENYNYRGDDWERPVHLELFEGGRRVVAQDAGVSIHGGYTRQYAQKGIRLSARAEYGTSRFTHRFFESKPEREFKRMIVRAAGHDNGRARLRDAALQTLVQHLPFETQHYQPVIVFINGEYWGLHEFRDRYDDHHIGIRYGLDRSQIVIMEDNASYAGGDWAGRDDYGEFLARITSGALQSWEEIDAEMDLDGYLDYLITEMYSANTDWPHGNIKYWRYRGPAESGNSFTDGRWRWLMYDVDWTFGYNSSIETNMVDFLLVSEERPERAWSRVFIRELLARPEVRHEFLQRLAVHLETTFRPDRVRAHLDSIARMIEPEIEEQVRRWTYPASFATWRSEVDKALAFAAGRPASFRQHTEEHFAEVTGTAELEIAGIVEGRGVALHTIPLSQWTPGVRISGGSWTGELFTGIPVVLRAEGVDLRAAVLSGGVTEVRQSQGELSFVMTGAARVELP